MQKIIIGIFLLQAFSCHAENSPTQTSKKKHTSDNRKSYYFNIQNKSKVINAVFCIHPKVGDGQCNIDILNDSNSKKIAISENYEVLFSSNNLIHYIVRSNENLEIKDVGEKKIAYRVYSPNDSIRNNELMFFYTCYKEKIPLLMEEVFNQMLNFVDKNRLYDHLTQITDIYKSNISFAQNFFSKHSVSPNFKQYINQYIKYDYYNKIYTYISKKNLIDSLQKSNFFDFQLDTLNEYNVANFKYYYFLINDFKYRVSNFFKTKESDIDQVFRFLDSVYSNFNAEYLKYYYLKMNMDSLYKTEGLLTNYILNIHSNKAREFLQLKFDDLSYYDMNTNQIVDTQGMKTSLSDILKKNKNKIIYIDFWASWCAPCRREFPYYKNLKDSLKGKDITFAFISIDQSKSEWEKAYKAEKLDTLINNYLLINPSKNFITRFNLTAIPAYVVFDKEGKVITRDAPRPSDKSAYSFLNKLIKE
jgi:thiol-disulfide isomerase/thioredoxin